MKHVGLSCAALALLVGCATVQQQSAKYQSGNFPDAGTRTVVNVGQVMVSSFDYLSNVTATMRAEVPGSFWAGRNGIMAGASLVSATSKGVQVFCQPPGNLGQPCVQDTNGDGSFDRASTFNAYGVLVNGRDIPPAEYRLTNQTILDGFKYELIYQGVNNGVVRIAYREFTENLARPAFSQDLTYTVAAGGNTPARFRDVEMVIHAADNTRIEYTVTSGFAGPAE